ncbi:hypothetical protein HYH02_009343 [Chlamydomonas schloesseri]|nr:hypothetical protein HYH02_009343 [Chlamydomonas schloesseri]|eukprot:KAG2443271.1 hypothetical protein HYH02_009343 [Chlamydomonas schloesseri]
MAAALMLQVRQDAGHSGRVLSVHRQCTGTPHSQAPAPTCSPAASTSADRLAGIDNGGLPSDGCGTGGQNRGGGGAGGSGRAGKVSIDAASDGGGGGGGHSSGRGVGSDLLQALLWPVLALFAMFAFWFAFWTLGRSLEKAATTHGDSIKEAATKRGDSIEKAAGKLNWMAVIGGVSYAVTHLLVELLARRGGNGGGAAAGLRQAPR